VEDPDPEEEQGSSLLRGSSDTFPGLLPGQWGAGDALSAGLAPSHPPLSFRQDVVRPPTRASALHDLQGSLIVVVLSSLGFT